MGTLSIDEITSAIDGKTTSNPHNRIDEILCDSRKINQNSEKNILFFALKGERFDGHQFVSESFDKGAKLAVVEYKPTNINNEDRLIYVDNTSTALGKLAKYYKSFFNIPVVGITGSVGKTITKEFIANVLSQKYNVLKSKGNFNTLVGLSLTIFEMNEYHDIAILELGTNHFGEIKNLTQICQPSIAFIICIGESHLEFLQDIDGVFQEKFDIFKFSHPDTLKIFNGNIIFLEKYKGNKNYISYGENVNNDFVLSSMSIENSRYSFRLNNEKYIIYDDVKHNIFNAIPAIILGKRYGLVNNEIQQGLLIKPDVNLRMEMLRNIKNNWYIIADCYNANPVSMHSALDYLNNLSSPNKFAILGDMLELGTKSIEFHKEIVSHIKQFKLNKVISIGELSNYYNGDVHYNSATEFLQDYDKYSFPHNSVILIKGSRALKLEKIVQRMVG
ncbi:MAG: UDP-N-acetylmuramoyl-tripeptide--D-alanyl-D-alanine ligase [Candidatus Cloacimonetes bacterium]|nr:UDP-N-acetylmuramoyl-tripeptide--D-alanyl-D-alanine ligase [Candidatus Cloacimonadota bacterium]MBL7086993.1 UDP-N-acetylmuramoyl-tripeptide--D-alanyl-D-alanine ligase [Candidatus Cloacimonadota bacterium]